VKQLANKNTVLRCWPALLAAIICYAGPDGAPGSEPETAGPLTVAEKSDFQATSRSAEVVQFIDQLSGAAPHLQKLEFGRTPQGRPLHCVVVAQPAIPEPAQLADDPRAVVLVLGNIHSGECAGKEAMLMLLRELAQHPDHPWLKSQVLLFVPNYSADSNDMVDLNNRPGQVGPAQGMGRRANAQDLDLNRDYMKLDSTECRALMELINRWDPHVFIDMHTTNGSWHRYALTYDVPHNPASPASIRTYMRQTMMPWVTSELEKKDIATFYYGNFNRDHTRWSTFGDFPRFGTEYMGLRGRLSILAEAYAHDPYQRRIVASREFLRQCLDFIAPRTLTIRQLLDDVRDQATTPARRASDDLVAIRSQVTPLEEKVMVRGYKPASQPRKQRVRPTEPKDYSVDFYTHFVPTMTVRRPTAYLVPADQQQIIDRLRWHGVALEQTKEAETRDVQVYRITSLSRRQRAYQNRNLLDIEVESSTQQRRVPPGTYIVRTNQALSNLIVYLLEPASNDGLATWNLFQPELTEDSEFPVWRVE
jgi:dipeptidyl-peptidase-4